MANIIILGDPHVGKNTSLGKVGIGSTLNSRVIDQINLLNWTLDQALERNAEHIIVTGDVFEDPKPHPSLIVLFLGWVKRCEAQGIKLHIVMGNHDILRSGTFITSPLDIISESEVDGCQIYKDLSTINIGSTSVTFVPFRDRKSFICESNADALAILKSTIQYELAAIPLTYNKLLIGHLALEGSIPVGDEIDDLTNELFCPLDMFNGYDFVWMGHVHKPQVLRKTPHLAHIGSMDISNFGETENKKYIILFDTDNISFTEIEIPTRPLRKISISIPKETKDSTSYVIEEIEKKKKELNNSIVKIEISLSSPELPSVDRNLIEKTLYKAGIFNISSFSESKKLSIVKKNDAVVIDNTIDINSALKKWADLKYKKEDDKKKRFLEVALSIVNKYKNEVKEP